MGAKTSRRAKPADESRQRILEAAFEIANELGYEGTTISKISARSGISASSIYWHFGSKDGLLAAVLTDSFERWEAVNMDLDAPLPGTSLEQHLRDIHAQAARSITENPEFWRLGLMLTLEQRISDVTARTQFLEIRSNVLGRLAGWWRKRMPPELVARRPDLAPLLARFNMATMDGLFVSAQADEGWDLQTLATMLADSQVFLLNQAASEDEGTRRNG